jgi:hypothetical protein
MRWRLNSGRREDGNAYRDQDEPTANERDNWDGEEGEL